VVPAPTGRGAADPQSAATLAAGLTSHEVEVLRLLVAGRSNPEIAEALFVSPRTAQTHVANIYRKLGVNSRAEAVDFAHRHGLLSSGPTAST
jgi:DNA-binding NarL/FixJ family response regulator